MAVIFMDPCVAQRSCRMPHCFQHSISPHVSHKKRALTSLRQYTRKWNFKAVHSSRTSPMQSPLLVVIAEKLSTAILLLEIGTLVVAGTSAALQIGDYDVGSDLQQRLQQKLPSLPFSGTAKEPEPVNPIEMLLNPDTPKAKAKRDKQAKDKERLQRDKEEKEKLEKARREQERIKKERDRLFRQQAILGGSALGLGALFIGKWQALAAGAAIMFRTVGGPTILSGVLRSPGLLFGRSLRVVEWDVARYPQIPNGRLVSFKLRALTPVGLRQAIVRNCGLSDGREVKQICHWIKDGPQFFEPLTSVPAFRMLPDPSWIVWSRRPRKGLDAIPYRLDERELIAQEEASFAALLAEQEIELMLRTINAVAAFSRGEDFQFNPMHKSVPKETQSGNRKTSTPLSVPKHSSSNNRHMTRQQADSAPEPVKLKRQHSANGFIATEIDEESEKQANQAAVARDKAARQKQSRNGACAAKEADLGEPGLKQGRSRLVGLGLPVRALADRISSAAADPVTATKSALGLPTRECQSSSEESSYQANVAGPSVGGQGAEYRASKPSALQVALEEMKERLQDLTFPQNFDTISHAEEDRLIAAAVSTECSGLRALFKLYATQDILDFIRFARACVAQSQHAELETT